MSPRRQLLLKCADISNVVKPAAVAREWTVAVTDEFFAQVRRLTSDW